MSEDPNGHSLPNYPPIQTPQSQQMMHFWAAQTAAIEQITEFKNYELPLARIKKIMKSDDEVRNQMISAEAPVLFTKACELFILELTIRSWMHTEENRRKTLQKSDISNALQQSDMYDFLIDIVPREEKSPKKISDETMRQQVTQQPDYYYFHQMAAQQQVMQQQSADQSAASMISARSSMVDPYMLYQQQHQQQHYPNAQSMRYYQSPSIIHPLQISDEHHHHQQQEEEHDQDDPLQHDSLHHSHHQMHHDLHSQHHQNHEVRQDLNPQELHHHQVDHETNELKPEDDSTSRQY